MSTLLGKLAETLGVKTEFTYGNNGEKKSIASDSVLKTLIKDLGYNANDETQIEKSLEKIEKRRWQRSMEAIYVVREDNKEIEVVLSAKEYQSELELKVAKEGKKTYKKVSIVAEEVERCECARRVYVKAKLKLNDALDLGYYDVILKTNMHEYRSMLAVTPYRCYDLNKNGKDKLFGLAVQLYSVRSKRNWGVGDFTDLRILIKLTARSGGDVIGLNPLNVLLHDYPESASPYASISRLFLNPIYIDVERVPEYQKQDKDENAILEAKKKENIDYTTVYNTKIQALRKIFDRVSADKTSAYYKEFQNFTKNDSGDLYRLAIFQTISEENHIKNAKIKLHSMSVSDIETFAKEHKHEVDFFMFLQFEADRQLREVGAEIKKSKMAIGLYRDLPVGVSKDSAEVWGNRYLYMNESGAGAPPDNYFPLGQKWGLGAFNPYELKESCYKPFIKILRANMRYAGAIRIDHVMGLSRLYMIPDKEKQGTYLTYNMEDMFNLLALESYLNKCVVVGECIGNVEPGFNEMLEARNIYALGVLWGERSDQAGTMTRPQNYKQKYFASVGTHDMPPLKAWWFGREIGLMHDLKFFTDEECRHGYCWRENERTKLLEALDSEGVWPNDNYRKSDYHYGEGYPEGIEEAVHAYMAKTNSEVFMMQPEDIFQSDKIQNLPGTDIDKYPNWRTKLPIDVEDMEESNFWKRHMAIVKNYR